MLTLDSIQKTELINKTLSPSEANDILNSMIENQINFFKLKRWSDWEHDHNCDCKDIDDMICDLKVLKNELKEQLHFARIEGKKVELVNKIELNIVD